MVFYRSKITQNDPKIIYISQPGEYLGVRQSGLPALSIADLTKDLPILEIARKDAFELIENDNGVNEEYLKNLITNYSGSQKSVDLINWYYKYGVKKWQKRL